MTQVDRTPGALADPSERGPSARNRLNLIEQITADAVASDYVGLAADPSRTSRQQRLLVAAIALGLTGFVLAVGVSARVINAPAVAEQKQALLDRIAEQESRQEELAPSVAALREQVEVARSAELEVVAGGAALSDQVKQYELVTGYVAVTGPGAVVTLQDAAPDPESEQPELERVLDSDIQRAVNGLWQAGAEAIAINRQRLTARSAIRSAAGAILVNYRPLRPPYVVEAIGPDSLAADFAASPDAAALRGVSEEFGIGLSIDGADKLRLPAATSALPEAAEVAVPEKGESP
jgi:uncharacterized protein YlxW (UPF0749 family)